MAILRGAAKLHRGGGGGGGGGAAGFGWGGPPLAVWPDNGGMIAWAGIEGIAAGQADAPVVARPRWPLDQTAAPMLGSGRKGAKA